MFADIRTVVAHWIGIAFPSQGNRNIVNGTRDLCHDMVEWMEERSSGFPADDPRLAGYSDLIACLNGSSPVLVPECSEIPCSTSSLLPH